ncbi:MAG: sugar-binding protein, partial [Lentisphaeria bacterium]
MAHAGLTQRQIWEARPWRLALLSLVLLAGANCPALAEEELFVSPLTDLGGLTLTPFGQCQATLTLDPERRFAGQPTATVSYQFKGKEYGICQLRFMPAALQPDMARISCRIYGDNSSNVAELYCVDAEGEIFKRNDGVGAPEWRVVDGYFKDFRHDPYSGSQNGNRKVDWPLKEIGLQVVNYGVWGKALPQGKMSLADLKIFASPQATGKALQQAADAGGDKLLVAAKAAGITVDGRLGDWEPRGGITLDSRSCKVIEGDGAGYSAEVRAAYDARTLYVAAVVRDPEVRGDFNGHNIYQNDGIELWFDIRGDSLFSMNQPDDYQIGLTFTTGLQRPGVWVWRNEKPAFLLAGIRSVTTKTPDGYVIEAAIPLDAFEGLVLPADGQVVHFNVSLCNTGAKTFSRLLWSGSHIGHPATFGLLAFGPPIPAAVAEARQKHAAQTASFITQNGLDSHYQGAPRIVKVDAATTVGRYHKYEIDVDLAAEYANPFDYDDFRLYGEFTSPSGTIQVVDGFHVQPQRIFIYGAPYFDSLTPHGPSKWQIRFAPTELGRYTFRVVGIDRKGRRATTEKSGFLSVTSPSDGFLRVSPDDPEYLQFDSGRKFFGIGYASHFWDKTGILTSLKNSLNQLAYFGANYTSINLENNANCGFMLETGKLGWYDQESASKLDYLISIAESRKVYLIPCLNQTGLALFDSWPSNKYNQANGGPCGSVVDYFSNPEALRLIKNRIRYTVARWGYSTAI